MRRSASAPRHDREADPAGGDEARASHHIEVQLGLRQHAQPDVAIDDPGDGDPGDQHRHGVHHGHASAVPKPAPAVCAAAHSPSANGGSISPAPMPSQR